MALALARPPVGDGERQVDEPGRRQARAREHPGETTRDGPPSRPRRKSDSADVADFAAGARRLAAKRAGRFAQPKDALIVPERRMVAQAIGVAGGRAVEDRFGKQTA